jgi:hypothetical protein
LMLWRRRNSQLGDYETRSGKRTRFASDRTRSGDHKYETALSPMKYHG